MAESTLSKIVRSFCRLERVYVQCTLVQFPSPLWFRSLAQEFEALHEIPRIVWAIDGSHIPTLAPIIERKKNYLNHFTWFYYKVLLTQNTYVEITNSDGQEVSTIKDDYN